MLFMSKKQMQIVNGAEMISRAAMDAGVNFFAGYPITPASSVYSTMLKKLQAQGKVALGVSDEISAMAMCLGAAMRGAKAMTSTAAPGFSLMIESIAYAFMTETPMLIVLGQRLGPSTGAATQNAEGDISFAANIISGGYTIPVIAPNSIENCYETTINAINISEKYRTPVVLLTEKDIIMSFKNINPNLLPSIDSYVAADLTDKEQLKQIDGKLKVIDRKFYNFEDSKVPFKTYNFNELNEVPDFIQAGANEFKVTITGSVHEKDGALSKTSPEAMEVLDHLNKKISNNIDEMSFYAEDYDFAESNEKTLTVISFLASDLSAKDAIKKARSKGVKIKHLTLYTLFPINEAVIKRAIKGSSAVIVPEENMTGQYADAVKHLLVDEDSKIIELIKVNKIGSLLSPEEIFQEIVSWHEKSKTVELVK